MYQFQGTNLNNIFSIIIQPIKQFKCLKALIPQNLFIPKNQTQIRKVNHKVKFYILVISLKNSSQTMMY